MSTKLAVSIDEVFKISEEMLKAVENEDWELLAEKEGQRIPVFELIFSKPIPSSDIEKVRDMVNYILQSDQKIVQQAQSVKQSIYAQFKQLSKGMEAFDAYKKNS